MGPLLRIPRHPLTLARFGLPTLLPASEVARLFGTEKARALFGGVAAHAFRPLHYPMTSANRAAPARCGTAWASPTAGSRAGRPKRASRSGCRGTRSSGPRMSSLSVS